MTYSVNLEKIDIIIYTLKIFFISMGTYYAVLKNTNEKHKTILDVIGIIITSIICSSIKYYSNSMNSIIFLILLLSIIFSGIGKKNIGYYILITTICLSINYIIFFIAIILSYFPNRIMNIQNNYIGLISIIIIYCPLIYLLFKIKKFSKGFSFLKEKLINDYFDILILNISIIILFLINILSEYKSIVTRRMFFGFTALIIITFVTIQKSLQLYYKQKLLIQDLNETKAELEKKNKEVEELEKENLNFSKTSHSIAHRQKSLEYKLNKLMLNTEIAAEMDLKDRMESISKDMQIETAMELDKTDIPEIDDMLEYMQSECIKNKIDFQLQINGNIHSMVNNHIRKDKLEILLADLIKNAIIAIGYSDNTNKSILVRIGMIDEYYSLYVYDSGIEFEPETLENLGKKPSTTHADNGGTGMGFMNTFDTLRECEASLIINELGKPCKDNFTKIIKIKFDKKNEYKIESYRENIEKL